MYLYTIDGLRQVKLTFVGDLQKGEKEIECVRLKDTVSHIVQLLCDVLQFFATAYTQKSYV